jgi:hypothetical protein
MKTMLAALSMMVWSAWLTPGTAQAAPGDAYDEPTRLEILDASRVSCEPRGALCIKPGAPTTVAAASPAMASAGRHAAAADMPRFIRVVDPARAARSRGADSSPWTLQVDARLRSTALPGNTLFLLYDASNQHAVSTREVAALWQAPVTGGDRLSARLLLSPEDGFHPAHNYRIRIVQIVGGKEVLLADGMVGLD